jgi:hypothetical protein
MRRRGQMKYRMPMLALVALLGAAFALAFAGCADQADVTSETVEELDEAGEEVFMEPGEEPGELIEPGIDAEEMTTDTPAHVREDQEDPQGPTEPGVESDELDPIETGPTGGGVDVEEMTDDTPPHTEDN